MKVLKKTDEYIIYQKRSGRYAVEDAFKKIINGIDKVNILIEAGIIKQAAAVVVAEEVVAEEVVAEEVVAEEVVAEEVVAEEVVAKKPATKKPATKKE